MARIPYPQYQNACGWNSLLPPRTDIRTLAGEVDADVVVVGAGYTGIAAARGWARERGDDRIVLLDASRIGEGNPGRNSGFLLEIALANDADASALARMQACNELIGQTMNRLRDDVYDRRNEIAKQQRGYKCIKFYPAGFLAVGSSENECKN